jgi:hypothetical protein
MKQYKFNMDITLDRSGLLMMEKGNKKKNLFGSAPRDGEISFFSNNGALPNSIHKLEKEIRAKFVNTMMMLLSIALR